MAPSKASAQPTLQEKSRQASVESQIMAARDQQPPAAGTAQAHGTSDDRFYCQLVFCDKSVTG